MAQHERVVLLDDTGLSIGSALKAEVHHGDTPLHLAFSCYLLNDAGTHVLVTRRALSKKTWPGTWTNTFCGHPAPGEEITDAVLRRAQHELGISVDELRLVLPDFRYRAVDASGIVENEICPVYLARALGEPVLNPDEVLEARWVHLADLSEAARLTPWAFSPWMVDQLAQLTRSIS